jgi:hypothetical protein
MAISDVVPRCYIVVGNGKLGALNKQRVAETLISKIFVDVEFHQTSKYYLVWMTHVWNMWKWRPSIFHRFLCTLGFEACRSLVFCLVDVNRNIRCDIRY